MSSTYIQEPLTNGKVCLHTTAGDIDIELWSKECPKACRNFIQLCTEGYYNGTIFHRVVKGFIVQGGDPTGTGTGGESIYGGTFKDEFHSRLRFVRRGLVAMANAGADDNGSQFFFTLAPAPELHNKHTIFGTVVGNTLFNMLKMGDANVDKDERPFSPHKIQSVEILNNPFDDIVPRAVVKEKKEKKEKAKESKAKATRDFNVLSFGDEMEEDEQDVDKLSKRMQQKGKSAHDVLECDSRLSEMPAYEPSSSNGQPSHDDQGEETSGAKEVRRRLEARRRAIKVADRVKTEAADDDDVDDDDMHGIMETERRREHIERAEELREESKRLRKEIIKSKRKEDERVEEEVEVKVPPAVAMYRAQRAKYVDSMKATVGRKDGGREAQTLDMLKKFECRMRSAKAHAPEQSAKPAAEAKAGPEPLSAKLDVDDEKDDTWMATTFVASDGVPRQANDANMRKDEDWYDITDPRHPVNKRRRGEATATGAK